MQLTSLKVDGRKKNLKIIQKTSKHYANLTMFLLDDSNHDIVDSLNVKHHSDPVVIVTDVYKEWIAGTGKKQVTWQTLVDVLKDIELNSLAEDIETGLKLETELK